MQHGERRIEPRGEAPDELRRERDLGDQHQRLLAAAHHLGDGAQVHLGLAAAGHAVQQERRVPARGRDDIARWLAAAPVSGRGRH